MASDLLREFDPTSGFVDSSPDLRHQQFPICSFSESILSHSFNSELALFKDTLEIRALSLGDLHTM